jgi:hypothetical protein
MLDEVQADALATAATVLTHDVLHELVVRRHDGAAKVNKAQLRAVLPPVHQVLCACALCAEGVSGSAAIQHWYRPGFTSRWQIFFRWQYRTARSKLCGGPPARDPLRRQASTPAAHRPLCAHATHPDDARNDVLRAELIARLLDAVQQVAACRAGQHRAARRYVTPCAGAVAGGGGGAPLQNAVTMWNVSLGLPSMMKALISQRHARRCEST